MTAKWLVEHHQLTGFVWIVILVIWGFFRKDSKEAVADAIAVGFAGMMFWLALLVALGDSPLIVWIPVATACIAFGIGALSYRWKIVRQKHQ